MEERTLVLIKPDGVRSGHIGEIISRFENKNFTIEQLKVTNVTDEKLKQHYFDKVNEPYFPTMSNYMKEGPIVAMVIKGTSVISCVRKISGSTSPAEAAPGTIRGDFGRLWEDGTVRNVMHSSDSVESAEREIKIWFE
ncbi:nucleoside-diphosphate kinase [Lactobacillus sp. YT155]|uniref:nucleoside-diphosphate kinase n=1 Tax=Lactobacillus sp. YT155 TaxID=3060955 RepID=UPI00265E46BF|nr:nucleoside-diphosphate kinase [Lactobacillus sp. YT155]MDO1605009.1 nucleoside-diphosphate kinase [Lactobacillus sp. YT155]